MSSNIVVRKNARLTKDKAKVLVASGLQRAVARLGKDEVALAAGCSSRCIEKALAHDTLPSIETILNALGADETIADELLAAYGFRLAPLHADAANDLETSAGLNDVSAAIQRALADGVKAPREKLQIADLLRPHMPALCGYIKEADELRGAVA